MFEELTDRKTEKGENITRLKLTMGFIDGETGEKESFGPFFAEGADKSDKGSYKAMTGAVKYALLKTFLIPTGDDPEVEDQKPVAKPSAPVQKTIAQPQVKAESQVDKVRKALGELAENFDKERWEKVRAATAKLSSAERDDELTEIYTKVRKIAESRAA
jgi:hypothetical protein